MCPGPQKWRPFTHSSGTRQGRRQIHRIVILAYTDVTDAPDGKYRIQYETNPVVVITVEAGGKASNGKMNILVVEPKAVDQRVHTYLGNTNLVTDFGKLQQKQVLPAS